MIISIAEISFNLNNISAIDIVKIMYQIKKYLFNLISVKYFYSIFFISLTIIFEACTMMYNECTS